MELRKVTREGAKVLKKIYGKDWHKHIDLSKLDPKQLAEMQKQLQGVLDPEQLAELDPETHAKVIRDLHDTQEALRAAETAREALVAQAKGKMLAYDEMAQDAVGAMLDGTLVYVDATPLLTRAALTGDVTMSINWCKRCSSASGRKKAG